MILIPLRLLSYFLILCLFALTSSGTLSAQEGLPTAHSQNNIALVIPLTGALAFLGNNVKDGFELYLEKHPDFRSSIHVTVEDSTTSELGRGISAVRRLIGSEKPDAIILALSPLVEALKGELDKAQIPMLSVIGSDATAGMDFGFKFWVQAKREFSIVAQAVVDRGQKRVVVIATVQISSIQRRNGFLDALRDLGAEKRVIESLEASSTEELSTLAAKTARLKPDAVVNLLLNGHSGLFARELKRLGYQGPVYGSVVLDDEAEIRISEGALIGAEYPYIVPADDFEAAYHARYGKRSSVGAANGYDIAMVLHEGLKNLGSLNDHRKFVDFVRQTSFNGAMGEYRFEKSEGNAFRFTPVLVKVKS